MNALLSFVEKLLVGIFILGFVALVIIGVARYREGESEEGGPSWREARKQNTIESYLEFLRDCQSCRHEEDAATALEGLQRPLGLVARLDQEHLSERAGIAMPLFSADGKTLLALGGTGPHFWDAETGQRLPGNEAGFAGGHGEKITALAFSADGTQIAAGFTGAENGNILVWDRQSGQQVAEHLVDGFDTQALIFLPGGHTLGWLAHGPVGVWDPGTGKFLRAVHEGAGTLAFARVDKTRTLMLTAAGRNVWFWDPDTMELARQTEMKSDRPLLGLSQDGRVVAYHEGPVLELWDTRTGAQMTALQDHDSDVLSFCRDTKKAWIVVGTREGSLYLWDIKSAALLGRLPAHEGPIEQLACSGRSRVVSVSWDSAKVWDLEKLRKGLADKPKAEE